MLLVGKWTLKLTDQVHSFVPELNLCIPELNVFPPITVGDMLHHTSGIRDQWVLVTLAGWRLSDDVVKLSDVLNLVSRMKTLNFYPASEYSYSNTNYTLAGLIVERASGLSLSEFAHRNIFVPLGMTSTTITESHGRIIKNRAYGYSGSYPAFAMRMPN